MQERERFVRLFKGERVDRVPLLDIMGVQEAALQRWYTEGLPPDADATAVRDIIGFDGDLGFQLPVNSFIWPEFEREIIETDGRSVMVRMPWGGVAQEIQGLDNMPLTVRQAIETVSDWDAIKMRLDAGAPGRLPPNWEAVCEQANQSHTPVFASVYPVGFFGGARELLGFERLLTWIRERPDFIHDMLDTFCDLWIQLYTRIQEVATFDYFMLWEDICFKGGSLINSALFRRFLMPRYQRLAAALRANGCPHIIVSSNGDQYDLVPIWLESGINITFPWESQLGQNIRGMQRQYPEMGIIGGVNTLALAHGKEEIDLQLKKIPPLLANGRYLPGLDRKVTPDVSWDNYRYFFEGLRAIL